MRKIGNVKNELDAVAIGERVHERRLELGFSQRDVNVDGVTYAYISRIEAGKRMPSLAALIGIGEWLGVTAEWLAFGDDRPRRCDFCGTYHRAPKRR